MKILLADDHELIRDETRLTLQRLHKDVEVIEASDFNSILELVEKHPDLDLVLLDLSMPGMSGQDAIAHLRQQAPSIPIAVVSASEDPSVIQACLQQGVQAYIPKTSTKEVFISALQITLSGSKYIPPALLSGMTMQSKYISNSNYTQAADQTTDSEIAQKYIPRLIQRQRDVLSLLKQGKTNREISTLLGMSEVTVRTHLTAAYKVLNVSNRNQAVHLLNQGFEDFQS